MSKLFDEVKSLMELVRTLRRERDELRAELSREFHVWTRDDLEVWADSRNVVITDSLWNNWCMTWCDIYDMEKDRANMNAVMDDWWEGIKENCRQE